MSEPDSALRLLVHRQNLRSTGISADPDAQRDLAAGQARLRIDRFALTASSISYAAFGDAMKYWQFFPSGTAGFGCVPVWGFATVVESRAAGVAPGERCYGFWPMGSHLVVTPIGVDEQGFSDGSAHRQNLPSPYNRVQFCRADPGYLPAREARQALLRPLFVTAFLIDDYLAEHGFFGARQVLLSSASSRTACGTALCLSSRSEPAPLPTITGLTASTNLAFTRSLGCYDQVLPYDDLSALDPLAPTVYVDMSGSAAQRLAVHHHFNGALSHSRPVGGAHWEALGPGVGLPGPRPTLFFAPAQLRGLPAPRPEDPDPEGLRRRIDAAWARLMAAMDGEDHEPWLQVQEGRGVEAVRAAYLALVEGRSDPRAGHMLSMWVH